MMSFYIILLCVVILFVYVKINAFRAIYHIRNLDGPLGLPFLGNTIDLMASPATFFKHIRAWSKNYGPLYRISLTSLYPAVNIAGSEELERIICTTKNIEKGIVYNMLNLWLGTGLLTSTGSKWHTRRKILTPAFHFNILQQFLTTFHSETKTLVDVLGKETEKPWTNVVPIISLFTLCAISETSMGATLNMKSETDRNYITATFKIGKLFFYRLMRPYLYSDWLYYNMNSQGRVENKLVNTLHTFTDGIIRKRAENFEMFETNEADEYNYYARKRMAFLDLLLNAKMSQGIIDDNGIKEEVNTFMFEGHDTTSMSICFTLMLLANYRKYQDEIYDEIMTVTGDNEQDPDINQLNEMKLMERFIKESLRLYPSVPYIARTLDEDVVINGHFIPKGEMVHIHIFDIHRNTKDWSDPEKFDPDRFLPENCVDRHPFAYVPFSAGPRNCIGQKFAMLELKAVLYGILKNFILEPVDTPDTVVLVPDMVLRTNHELLKVKFCKRHDTN